MKSMKRWQVIVAASLLLSLVFMAAPGTQQPVSAADAEQPVSHETHLEPTINKKFNPTTIAPGATSRLTVEMYNPNDYQLIEVAFTDTMGEYLDEVGGTDHTEIIIAADPQAVSTCGGTVTAVPGSNEFSLSGGTLPPKVGSVNGYCEVSVNVTGFADGNWDNRIPVGAMTAIDIPDPGYPVHNFSNQTDVQETLNIADMSEPDITKSFSPDTPWVGQRSRLRLRIQNRDATYALHDVALTDNLPANMQVASPASISDNGNCGSYSIDADPGDTSIVISDADIPADTTCRIDVYVIATAEGNYTNTIPGGTLTSYEQVTDPNPASDNLTAYGIRPYKIFSPDRILAGEDTSTLTITIRNPYTEPLTSASISDTLPGLLYFVSGTETSTCGSPTLTLSNGDQTISMTGGTLPAGVESNGNVTPGVCTITVDVEAPGGDGGGTYTNTVPASTLYAEDSLGNPFTNAYSFSDNIRVDPQSIDVTKSYSPSRLEVGNTTTLRITLTNPTSSIINGVAFTDQMPSGMVPTAVLTNTCGALGDVTIDTVADPDEVNVINGTIPANGSCYVEVTVQVTNTGSINNCIPANAIGTTPGITNLDQECRAVTVYPTNEGVVASKTFSTNNTVPTAGDFYVTLDFTAPQDETLTDVGIIDILPAGMTVTNSSGPNISGCGSPTVNIVTGSDTIQLTGATINAGALCRVRVWVHAAEPALYTNTMDPTAFTNPSGQSFPSPISDSIRVSDFWIEKSFSHSPITRGGKSIITITLHNDNPEPIIDGSLRDNLDTMGNNEFLLADPYDFTHTCTNATTANPVGDDEITISNIQIPGNSSCDVSFTIEAQATATLGTGTTTNRNTINTGDASVQWNNIPDYHPPRSQVRENLNVVEMDIDLVKKFNPSAVFGGSPSQMTITLINPNDVPIEDISFTDNMPVGMVITDPMGIDTTTCGGSVSVAVDRQSFTFSGGYLASNRQCQVKINATLTVNNNLVNTIPAGAVDSFIGITNPFPASSTLSNLPGVSVRKFFTPNQVKLNEISILTLEFSNSSPTAPVTHMDLHDIFPDDLIIAPSPAATNTCGGTVTTGTEVTGEYYVDLDDGELALFEDPGGGDVCQITVPVYAENPGAYKNVIPENAIIADDGVTNVLPTEDTLTVVGTPALEIVKNVTSTGPYIETDIITYVIIVTSTGDIPVNNVLVTDPTPGVVMGACTPVQGSTLDVGETMTCSATHAVTADDITAGFFTNTAYADSDETDPVDDDETVVLDGSASMSVTKSTTSTGPYYLGDTISYEIVVRNIGEVILNNVTVSDPGVTLGTCSPVQGSSLNPTESMTCTATYVVTQADVDAAVYSNTATADSDETAPEDDTVDVPIANFPVLGVYKFQTTSGPFQLGDTITYTIAVKNEGNTTLTNVTVVDTGTEQPLGPCVINEDPTNVSLPTTLNPNDILYCEAYHEVTQADVDAGEYTNTAVGDSDETDSDEGSVTVDILQIPGITIVKTGTKDDLTGDDAGDTISYTFTVTNSGTVTLSSVGVTDPQLDLSGISCEYDADNSSVANGSAILGPGESITCTVSGAYTVTQTDIDAGTFTNTATGTGRTPQDSPITDTDDDTKTFTQTPGIELLKTGTLDIDSTAPLGEANPGDVITYAFTVTNTGNVTLTDITLSDTVGGVSISGGPIASLAPGASDTTTFTGTYTITQTDIDAGTFNNEAEVSGDDPGGDPVTDDDDHDEPIPQNPDITIVKTGALDMTIVAPNTRADVGDQINYTFTVTNTGNVTLTDVEVNDLVGGIIVSGGPVDLDPGEVDSLTFTAVYTLTQSDIDAGTFYNNAEARGDDPGGNDVTDEDDHIEPITQEPSIELEKTGTLDMTMVAPNTRADVGDVINYTFTITNTGNVTLTDVTISDTVGGVTITGGPIASLAPGASDNTTITGSYTLTQADIDAGNFYNQAEVSGDDPGGNPVTDDDDHDQPITDVPSIDLVKTGTLDDTVVAPNGEPNPGDVINYSFTVTNTGNVTLTNITLADTVGGVTITGGPIASLAPGASDNTTFTGSYTLTQADINAGNFYNQAEVTGTPPVGDDVIDDDDHDEPLDQNPGISLIKTGTLDQAVVAPNTRPDPGDQINYTFTVTNTGNVTLTNVDITDAVPGVVISGGPITLNPGQVDSTTFTAVYTLTVADLDAGTFTNTATVTGEDPGGNDVTDDDPDTQNFPADPSIQLDKTGTIDDTVVAPSGRVDVGDQINYVFTVTNTGNVTLNNVTVTDTVGGVTVSGTIASLAPGASDNTSITGVYTLTQTDIDAGTFYNEAEVEGTDPNSTVVTDDDDDEQALTQEPSIQLEKTGTLDDTVVAPAGQVNAGDQITYVFTVTNTGNTTLTNITLADTVGGVTISGGPIATLAPGASDNITFTGVYTLTQADVDAGSFYNEAEVTGEDPGGNDVTDEDDDQQTFTPEPSIDLQKIGTLDETIVPLVTRADEGDVINYVFRIENTGNVTLYNIQVTDTIGGVTITGGPIASLAPGEVDDTTITGQYTLTQADVDSGSFYNEANVSGTDPNSTPVEDDDDDTQSLIDEGTLGIAKDVSDDPSEVTPGVWQFTYRLYIENAGNVTLTEVQVTDDLSAVFGTMFFQVLEVRSDDFTLNPLYDGDLETELLDGTDTLLPGDFGYIEIDVEFIPENRGPFENTATVVGTNPSDEEVSDDSQDGVDPDPDDDDDPTNNNEPTPLDFPPYIFDPPFGIKVFDNAGLPLLRWTMVWINGSNIVPLYSRVSDPIPVNATFYDDGIPSGYDLPVGPHPAGTTTNGVECTPEEGYTGSSTTTTYCYYEGPTIEYPRGRIVWEGVIGPDFGAEDEEDATNEIYISFSIRVNNSSQDVNNEAEIGADLEGDGDIEGNEIVVAEASETWFAEVLPETGFAPGEITILPQQPAEKAYTNTGITVEIPSLGISANVVTVPFEDGTWDVTWLGNAVGYLEGSAYPTWQGNTVLTAHNRTPYDQPGIFLDINDLGYGNTIIIHAFGMTYTYEMRSARYVTSRDLNTVFQHEELDWVTLMTCYGYDEETGEYRYRYLVRAVLVSVQ